MISKKWAVVCGLCMMTVGICAFALGWIARPDGIGPVRIGMTLSQVDSVLHESFVEPKDEEERQCFYVYPSHYPGVSLMIQDRRIVRFDIDGAGVPTGPGIRVGDPVAKVMKAYGSSLEIEPNHYDDQERYLTVRSPDRRYAVRFETDHGKIGRFYAGTPSAVSLIEGCS